MKRASLSILLALLCAVAGWYARQFFASSGPAGSPTTRRGAAADSADAIASGPEAVVAMGRIEPAAGVIDVGAMAGDRLGKLAVEEGSVVCAGDPLADLESRTLRKLELEAAATQLQLAKDRLQVEEPLAEVRIDVARLGLKKAEAAGSGIESQKEKVRLLDETWQAALRDQKRLKNLSKELASDQERERQSLTVAQAEAELQAARAALKQMEENYRLGIEAAKLDVAVAEAARKQLPFTIPVRSLDINYRLAVAQYERTRIVSPCNGSVLKIYVRPGETIGNKPVLQVADLSRMVVVTEVYENELQYLRPGQEAMVSSRAIRLPEGQIRLSGKVARIGRMIGAPSLRTVDPFAPADRHVVEVRVELDEKDGRLAREFTNLQVDVRFPVRGGAEKTESNDLDH